MKKLLICGGGFAGVWAAMSAAATAASHHKTELSITLVSDRADLCIRPRLYEGAAPDMLVPLAPLMDEIGVDLVRGVVTDIASDVVRMADHRSLRFDRLVLAAGSHVALPNVPGAARFGFLADTYESTAKLDAHLQALDPSSEAARTVVVVGARFTGLEVATNLRSRFGSSLNILLLDRKDRPGAGLGEAVEAEVAMALTEAGITFLPGTSVASLTSDSVRLSSGAEIPARTVVFSTGLRASPLAAKLGVPTERDGRVAVAPDLRVPQAPAVFASGDVARAMADEHHATLMSCQHAIPTGVVAGRNAVRDMLGLSTDAYAQPLYATCLDLGAYGSVFTNGWSRRILKTRDAGAAMKAEINTQWIYPPAPERGRDAIFDDIRNLQAAATADMAA